jgi:hypothetical protein
MKKLIALLMVLPFVLFTIGCDSVDADDPGTGDDPTAVHGTWESTGDNVAPGLAALGFNNITATFTAEGTYTVNSMFGEIPVLQEGTYSTQASAHGEIRTIELEQTVPTSLTARGIYEVSADGQTMTYEVVDITQGTPPTAAAGFGSTVAGDDPAGHWTQVFVRTN